MYRCKTNSQVQEVANIILHLPLPRSPFTVMIGPIQCRQPSNVVIDTTDHPSDVVIDTLGYEQEMTESEASIRPDAEVNLVSLAVYIYAFFFNIVHSSLKLYFQRAFMNLIQIQNYCFPELLNDTYALCAHTTGNSAISLTIFNAISVL